MGVLRLRRRPPPALPLEVFGETWKQWLIDAAAAAACPVDYVAAPLLASVSALIGNARWAQAWPGWSEPPHLWLVAVGDSGTGKSPGADCLMRDVLPEIERRMIGDYPDRLREWQAAVEFDKIAKKRWQDDLRTAQENKKPLPPMPMPVASSDRAGKAAPASARRDDRAGRRTSRHRRAERPAGRARRDRRLVDGNGRLQPRRPRFLARGLWRAPVSGRAAQARRGANRDRAPGCRGLWRHAAGTAYPSCRPAPTTGCFRASCGCGPTPSRSGAETATPNAAWAIEALDRLRELDLAPGDPAKPDLDAADPRRAALMEEFGSEMEARLDQSGGLLRSAYGKARGAALRLSLVLEWLWCCGKADMPMPPDSISEEAFVAAATLVGEYFMPMAERVFGDAGASDVERNAATLARWIIKERPHEVHVRRMQREVRLPGLRSAEQIKAAAKVLVDADWLRAPVIGFGSRAARSSTPSIPSYGGSDGEVARAASGR